LTKREYENDLFDMLWQIKELEKQVEGARATVAVYS